MRGSGHAQGNALCGVLQQRLKRRQAGGYPVTLDEFKRIPQTEPTARAERSPASVPGVLRAAGPPSARRRTNGLCKAHDGSGVNYRADASRSSSRATTSSRSRASATAGARAASGSRAAGVGLCRRCEKEWSQRGRPELTAFYQIATLCSRSGDGRADLPCRAARASSRLNCCMWRSGSAQQQRRAGPRGVRRAGSRGA